MTLLIFIYFVSAFIWKLHAIVMCYIYVIEEINFSWKIFVILSSIYVKRNNCVVKTHFIVGLLLHRGMNTSWSPLIVLCYIPFIWTFIYLTRFQPVPIFKRFIMLGSVNAITCAYWLICEINFNSCLVSNLLGVTYECYVG